MLILYYNQSSIHCLDNTHPSIHYILSNYFSFGLFLFSHFRIIYIFIMGCFYIFYTVSLFIDSLLFFCNFLLSSFISLFSSTCLFYVSLFPIYILHFTFLNFFLYFLQSIFYRYIIIYTN